MKYGNRLLTVDGCSTCRIHGAEQRQPVQEAATIERILQAQKEAKKRIFWSMQA